MAINLSAVKDYLWPGLHAVTGKYDMIPTQFSKVFDKTMSKMALEITSEARFLGLAQLKNEGAGIAMDNNAGGRFKYNQKHTMFGLGYVITREAIDDNLYKTEFPTNNLGLQHSFLQTKEIQAAQVFNSAFTVNPLVGGDGVALCSTAHPIDGGTVANRPAIDISLSESSLLAAQLSIPQTFKDIAGLKIMARAQKLIIPRSLEGVATRLLKTELRPGTSDNDVNAIRTVADGLRDFVVMDFLTSPFAWFLKTNIDGLMWFQRMPYEADMQEDFDSKSLKVSAMERYSFGYNNWRAIYGTAPTS